MALDTPPGTAIWPWIHLLVRPYGPVLGTSRRPYGPVLGTSRVPYGPGYTSRVPYGPGYTSWRPPDSLLVVLIGYLEASQTAYSGCIEA